MMDNTRKRKIVRNFVIGYLLLQVLVIVLYLGFWAVHPGGFVVAENERMSPPPMFPDYQGVTIPYNNRYRQTALSRRQEACLEPLS